MQTDSRPSRKTYWLKNSTLPALCFLAVKSFFTRSTIYYDDEVVTPRARKFLAWLSGIRTSLIIHPTLIDFNAKDAEGLNQRHFASHNMNVMAYRFLATHYPNVDDREKQLVITYLWGYIADKMQFISLIAEKIGTTELSEHKIYIESGPMNATIAAFFATQGIRVGTIFDPTTYLRQWLVPYAYFLMVCWAMLSPRKDNTNIMKIRPAVWVEYYYPWRNEHAFWREHLQNPNFDRVYYLDRDDTPMAPDTLADIEARDMKWLDAHTLPIIRMSRVTPRQAWRLLAEYILSSRSLPLWFKVLRFQERIWYSIYEAVFKRYQVKMLFQQQDLGWKQAVQARAMEAVGGILVGYHWSNLPHCWENTFLTAQHVYFVWGSAMRACLEKKKNSCSHIIPCGLWIKAGLEEGPPPELARLSSNVKFIFTIFDSDVGHYWIMTPPTLSDFFIKLLELLEAYASWGAVLKSKSASITQYAEILPRGAEIVARMDALRNQGRFVILDPKYLPMTAMAHSQIGVCYTINTAGIISGMHGYRAIHWECVGVENPIYWDGSQQVLFKTLDGLGDALIRAADGDKSVGDFSRWRRWSNYFDDAEGGARVAYFIHKFMGEVSAAKDYRDAMERAVCLYNKNYGVPFDWAISFPNEQRELMSSIHALE